MIPLISYVARLFLQITVLAFLLFGCKSNTTDETTASGPLAHIEVGADYEVEIAAGPDLLDYPMFATLDETGRLFVFESTGNVYQTSQAAIDTPRFRIKLLLDENEDGIYDRASIFADSLSFPQGGVFYQGSLYASSAPDLLKLTDHDGDGIAEEREVLLSGWFLNVNANSLIGPFMGPDGWLYLTNAIEGFDVTTQEGKRLKGETARIWRVRPDGSQLEWIAAGGMNNPVELAFTETGEVLGTQTFFVEPQRGLRDALTYWTEGGIYGKKNKNISRDRLARTGELMPVVSQYSRVAPSGIGRYRSSILGADFTDNFFTAQFNAHRVIRHRLFREGGSFRTEDEVFLSTEQTDFHPTDVLEGGDGSLLVVETGGWFILGCPLSQVSKPQLKGSIYRIKRKDTEPLHDPFGNAISWQTLGAEPTAELLNGPRPFVSDRALERLVTIGPEAVPILAQVLSESASPSVRTRTIFALYRIGGTKAITAIHQGFADPDEKVRIAVARTTGMAKDPGAVGGLIALLEDNSLQVRRQAATALGQIGATQAIPHLLRAADTEDRFVKHAVTYALIALNRPKETAAGLKSPSFRVKEATLIALDQMPGQALQAAQLLPFLHAPETELQKTALWIATHHPEWSQPVGGFLQSRLSGGNVSKEEAPLLGNIMIAFCGDPSLQNLVTDWLRAGSEPLKIYLMNQMANCDEKAFPESWTKALAGELGSGPSAEVKAAIVDLIRLRHLHSLGSLLDHEADDPQNPPALRTKAAAAALENQAVLNRERFEYLYEVLTSTEDAALRQQVAHIFSKSELTDRQRTTLARDYLRRADHFTLPVLLPAFRGKYSLEIGESLAQTLLESSVLDNLTTAYVEDLFREYPSEVAPLVNRLTTKLETQRKGRLDRILQLESLVSTGDEGRGRALYFGKATCWTCHTIGEEGGRLGPDLTSIQSDRSVHDILEAILYPGVSFVREYETYEVQTSTNTYTGIIREQSPEFIVLGLGPDASVRLRREDITSIALQETSLMPQGFGELLTDSEMADLVAFLLANDLIY